MCVLTMLDDSLLLSGSLLSGSLLSGSLLGGMPVVTLSDVARLRLDSISFFLLLIVLATFVVRWCWNTIAVEFPRLPTLTIRKAFAVVVLWGLVFLLALTMISGARELLTPGAWEKSGLTYKVRPQGDSANVGGPLPIHENDREARRARLSTVYELLEAYAREHDEKFPSQLADAVAEDSLRHPPQWRNAEYEYLAGNRLDSGGTRLLAEPNVYQGTRFAVLVGGVIVEE